jgi:serine acetyltransferase
MSIRQALNEDAQFYRELRFGARRSTVAARFSWLISTGLFVLAMHRTAHHFQQLRHQHGYRSKSIALRSLLAIGRPLLLFRAKSDITGVTEVASGVFFSDLGQLVIGARSIGRGTVIHHAVTIGMSTMTHGTPHVGANVWIGPDCVVYGNIEIGDGCTLLPGTVLSKSVPPRSVVKGNPGRIIKTDFDNSRLRSSLNYDVCLADLNAGG